MAREICAKAVEVELRRARVGMQEPATGAEYAEQQIFLRHLSHSQASGIIGGKRKSVVHMRMKRWCRRHALGVLGDHRRGVDTNQRRNPAHVDVVRHRS